MNKHGKEFYGGYPDDPWIKKVVIVLLAIGLLMIAWRRVLGI